MKKYWISWKHCAYFSPFEIHSPWWISGKSADCEYSMICAALKAKDEEKACEFIYKSYDKEPKEIEFRFCQHQDKDWSPFSERFPKAEWMKWDA